MGDYDNLDSDALRELCRRRGLAYYGNKAALRARLEQVDAPPVEDVTPGWDAMAEASYAALPLVQAELATAPAQPAKSEDPNAGRIVYPGCFRIGYVLGDGFDDDQHQALLAETVAQAQDAGHSVKSGGRLVSLTPDGDGTHTALYEVIVRRASP